MTDRELLEDAAKAMGWSLFYYGTHCTVQTEPGKLMEWDPLIDDGDAFRLAVWLKLCIDHDYVEVETFTFNGITEGEYEAGVEVWRIVPEEPNITVEEVYGDDPLAATRLAIVRAAAEIGKNL